MATIKCFEDVEGWKLARELYNILGDYINERKFKRNFSLIDQIERSSGSVMDNIAEGFEREAEPNLLFSWAMQKAQQVKSGRNYIGH